MNRMPFAVRLILAAGLALLAGAVSLWWLGTSWWSVVIASVSAVATYVLSLRPRPEAPDA